MKIIKELKYITFEWDEEDNSFTITEEDGNRVILNKVYAFAFMRFIVRMSQRNWRRAKKAVDKNQNESILIEEEDEAQLEFLLEETLTANIE